MTPHIQRDSLWDYAQFAVSKLIWFGGEKSELTNSVPPLVLASEIPKLIVMATRDIKNEPDALDKLSQPEVVQAMSVIEAKLKRAIEAGRIAVYDPVAFLKVDLDDATAITTDLLARLDDISTWLETQGIFISHLPSKDPDELVKPLGSNERKAYLNIIGAMLELLKTPREGRFNDASVIKELIENYGDKHGISKSNLDRKFPEAKRSLEET